MTQGGQDSSSDSVAPLAIDAATIFFVFEVTNAEPLAGELFRRRFNTDDFPKEPIHVVAMCKLPDASWSVLGYVHYYPWNDCVLCGGLVIDERSYRKLPANYRQALRAQGGVAEIMLRKSIARLPQGIKAVWGRIGDLQSEVVCRRVGFESTDTQYIFAVWLDKSLTVEQRAAYVQQVETLGPF